MGLDENVAGVTFLAFGNGSPDMFSTFSAMRTNTASLALGELLGAASFIVSVVVGAICLVRPFKVDPYPFLRDVCFFAAAVGLLQATLWDGVLYLWETLSLVALYVLYVLVVIVGSWWTNRRDHRRRLSATVRGEYAEDDLLTLAEGPEGYEPYRDEPNSSSSPTVVDLLSPGISTSGRNRATSAPDPYHPGLSRLNIPARPASRGAGSHTGTPLLTPAESTGGSPTEREREHEHRHSAMMASFSLVGALEFREFVQGMTPHASSAHLAQFEPPTGSTTPFAGGYYNQRSISRGRTPFGHGHSRNNSYASHSHGHGHSHGPSRAGTGGSTGISGAGAGEMARERDPWDAAFGGSLQLDERAHSPAPDRMSQSLAFEPRSPGADPVSAFPSVNAAVAERQNRDQAQAVSDSPEDGVGPSANVSQGQQQPNATPVLVRTRTQRTLRALRSAASVLFPTLHGFAGKSAATKLASVFAAPAVLALRITLPVVITPYGGLEVGEGVLEKEERERERIKARSRSRAHSRMQSYSQSVGRASGHRHGAGSGDSARAMGLGLTHEDNANANGLGNGIALPLSPTSPTPQILVNVESPTGSIHIDEGLGPRPIYFDDGGWGGDVREGEGEDDVERARRGEEDVLEELHDHLRFHKWLTAAQCVFGPVFVAKVLFGECAVPLYMILCQIG
jgi:sodium/potassium/calcium exchanger 6